MYENLFLNILNMSATASFVIIIVLIARLALKKTPKIFSYILWAVVLFRLLVPVTFESAIGLLPDTTPIQQSLNTTETLQSTNTPYSPSTNYSPNNELNPNTAITTLPVNNQIAPPLTAPNELLTDNATPNTNFTASATQNLNWIYISAIIWCVGAISMLIYGIVSYIILKQKLISAVHLKDNLYHADYITTPFVVGVIKPKIYIPVSLPLSEMDFIIAHEKCHIKRFDHITRLFAYTALALHWFNPLAWVAFTISNKDMEMSCDEAVMRSMSKDIRAEYISALLRLATGRKLLLTAPLAFDEGDPKGRIINIMKYKKPLIGVSITAVIAIVVLSVALMSTQKQSPSSAQESADNLLTAEQTVAENAHPIEIKTSESSHSVPLYTNETELNTEQLTTMHLDYFEQELNIIYPEAFGDTVYFEMESYYYSAVPKNTKFNTELANAQLLSLADISNTESGKITLDNNIINPTLDINANYIICYISSTENPQAKYAFKVVINHENTLSPNNVLADICFWKDENNELFFTLFTGADIDKSEQAIYDKNNATNDINVIAQELLAFGQALQIQIIEMQELTPEEKNPAIRELYDLLSDKIDFDIYEKDNIMLTSVLYLTTNFFELEAGYTTILNIYIWKTTDNQTYFSIIEKTNDDTQLTMDNIFEHVFKHVFNEENAFTNVQDLSAKLIELGENQQVGIHIIPVTYFSDSGLDFSEDEVHEISLDISEQIGGSIDYDVIFSLPHNDPRY